MLKKLFKERRSVAALEFVLVAPLLILLLFGVYDLSSALITYEEVYSAAHSMAASISNEAVVSTGTTAGTNALTYTQIQQAESLLWAEIPTLRSGLQDGVKSITVSSIVYEILPNTTATTTTSKGVTTTTVTTNGICTASATQQCNYVPIVVWSVAYQGGDSNRTFDKPTDGTNTFSSGTWTTLTGSPLTGDTLRSCNGTATTPTTQVSTVTHNGSLNQTTATSGTSSDMTNLRTYTLSTPAPANPAPPSPMLVVDVQLNYQPVIGLFIQKAIPLWVNGYWPVRSVEVSPTQTYALNEEFVTITPNTTNTAYKLSDYNATNNQDFELFDATNTFVPTANYCVNTTLYGTYGVSPETPPP